MIPRKPLPHPELRDQQNKPLPDLYPTAVVADAGQGLDTK
jgi:carboxypeptidase Q